MCIEDKHQLDMWLSCCFALTSESWKTCSNKNTATVSVMKQLAGLAIMFTLAESLKNIVYRPIQDYMNFKSYFLIPKFSFAKKFILTLFQ
jgi:hypothetical protein